jgi:penicillin-binding protein 1A
LFFALCLPERYHEPMSGKKKLSLPILLVFILAGAAAGITLGLVLVISPDLPQIHALESFEPGAATRIMSADGRLIAELYVEKRIPLPLEEIPADLRHAVVAVEDRRFHRHPGLDVIRNVGAIINDIRAGSMVEGASTITQQLARNLFLTPEKTLRRKLKEIFLALQIERRYTKEEILEMYLNQIYLGAGAYGVGAAAEIYFNKSVSELTLDEIALIAGLPQAPEGYSPYRHPERIIARRRRVLKAMVREGYVTSAQAAQAAEAPLKLTPRKQAVRFAPHFVEMVTSELIELFGENQVYRGGLTVTTTLRFTDQMAAEKAIADGLRSLALKAEPHTTEASITALPEVKLSGALVALEVGTGAITAWVGGSEFDPNLPDMAYETPHPPAGAFQVLIYAAALESGLSQADRVWDAPIRYQIPGRIEPWEPKNTSRRFEGEITLRRALEVSGNIPAVKILSRIGLENFIGIVRKLGINSPLAQDLTLALGTSPVTLLEMTTAYNTLAGGGLWVEPHAIYQVEDRTGRVIHQTAFKRHKAISPEAAFITTDMLQGVVRNGTAQQAKTLGRMVAGKTGTGPDFKNAVFLGYSPTVCAGVWLGFDGPGEFQKDQRAALTALPIWIEFMGGALKSRPWKTFDPPAGIIMSPMDRFTGKTGSLGDSGVVMGAFREGTQP